MATEYTVHFLKGFKVGARSLRMVTVQADNAKDAETKAWAEFNQPGDRLTGYRLTRIDHFEGGRVVRDRG